MFIIFSSDEMPVDPNPSLRTDEKSPDKKPEPLEKHGTKKTVQERIKNSLSAVLNVLPSKKIRTQNKNNTKHKAKKYKSRDKCVTDEAPNIRSNQLMSPDHESQQTITKEATITLTPDSANDIQSINTPDYTNSDRPRTADSTTSARDPETHEHLPSASCSNLHRLSDEDFGDHLHDQVPSVSSVAERVSKILQPRTIDLIQSIDMAQLREQVDIDPTQGNMDAPIDVFLQEQQPRHDGDSPPCVHIESETDNGKRCNFLTSDSHFKTLISNNLDQKQALGEGSAVFYLDDSGLLNYSDPGLTSSNINHTNEEMHDVHDNINCFSRDHSHLLDEHITAVCEDIDETRNDMHKRAEVQSGIYMKDDILLDQDEEEYYSSELDYVQHENAEPEQVGYWHATYQDNVALQARRSISPSEEMAARGETPVDSRTYRREDDVEQRFIKRPGTPGLIPIPKETYVANCGRVTPDLLPDNTQYVWPLQESKIVEHPPMDITQSELRDIKKQFFRSDNTDEFRRGAMTVAYHKARNVRWLTDRAARASRLNSHHDVHLQNKTEHASGIHKTVDDIFITAPNACVDEEETHVGCFVDQRYCERHDGTPHYPEYKTVKPEDLDDWHADRHSISNGRTASEDERCTMQ